MPRCARSLLLDASLLSCILLASCAESARPAESAAAPATNSASAASSPTTEQPVPTPSAPSAAPAAPAAAQPAAAKPEPTSQLADAEARTLAEQQLAQLSSFFLDLTLAPAGLEPDAHRFELQGRIPGAKDASVVGVLTVGDDRSVKFSGVGESSSYAMPEALARERQKRSAVARVYQVTEVARFCKANTRCTHLIEGTPRAGCTPKDEDRRQCAWNVSIRTVEPSGAHMGNFAGFYVRNDGTLFVEPVETGSVVTLKEWRCLQKHSFDAAACEGLE